MEHAHPWSLNAKPQIWDMHTVGADEAQHLAGAWHGHAVKLEGVRAWWFSLAYCGLA